MDEDIQELLNRRCCDEAFDLVAGRFKDRIFRLAFSMLRDESLAEDLAQDVLVRVWKALPDFRGGASLSTWIYAITRNACLTEIKRRAARPSVSLDAMEFEAAASLLPAAQTAEPVAGAGMDARVFLSQLPEKYRQVIELYYLEQKAYIEIAALLGIPMGTVKTLLFRAKQELMRIAARPPASGLASRGS